MAAPAIDTSKLAIGYAIMWYAVSDTAKPTTVYGGDLGASVAAWDYIGATQEGITWNNSTDTNDLFVEESRTAVMTQPGTGTFAFSAALAEISPVNVQLWMGGGGTLSGTAGSEQYIPSETLEEYAIVVDAPAAGTDKILRIYVPRARVVASDDTSFRRAENYQTLGITVTANCAYSDLRFNWATAS